MLNVPQLKALGGLRLESTGLKPIQFTQPKPLLLLSYLSLEGPQSRRHLAELCWPGGNSMKSLSMALTRLRQGAGDIVNADHKKAWITIPSDVKGLLEALDHSDWEKVGRVYTGAFLESVVLGDWSNELEEWVYTTREYLAERVQYALLNLAEEAAKRQAFERVRNLAERAYKLPGSGSLDPHQLKRLYLLLTAGQSLLAPEVRKEVEGYGITLELSTEKARARFQTETHDSLPLRGTSFVGRDEELTDLATLLSKPGVALISVLGPAGVGKTRLALQLAHEQQKLKTFKGGVHFVPFDALNDATLIASRLINHFDLIQKGDTEPFEQLTQFISHKPILLVLDNFEHLIEGSTLISELLSKCPNLKMLVTSREKLHLEEEYLFNLEGLPYPQTVSPDAKLSNAVQLFSERAKQIKPPFEIEPHLSDVLRICQLVDGLPLGIELAASWVRVMSCREIACEIEKGLELLTSTSKNIPKRHRSLRAAFEQSWKLLSSKEQEVLRKLAIFVGGFRRDAASDVAGATIPALASLVDKSLLKVLSNGRYDRHPLLYQFTREKLYESNHELEELQQRYAAYYKTFVAKADSQLQGHEQIMWFGRLDQELENMREVLRFLETKDDLSHALYFATSLGYYWMTRGYYNEGVSHLLNLLHNTAGQTPIRAKALIHAGNLLWKQGHHTQAKILYEQSLAIASADDFAWRPEALIGLGRIAELNHGDFGQARSYYQNAFELAQQSDNKVLTADALRLLGAVHIELGNYHQARTFYENSEVLYDELGHLQGRAKALTNLATVLTYLGEHSKAQEVNHQGLEIFRAVGDTHGIGIALLNLGFVQEADDRQKGNAYYQQSLQIFRDLGDQRMVSHLLNNLAANYQKLCEPHKAQPLLEESLGLQNYIGDVSLIAHALFIFSQVKRDLGHHASAWQTAAECITLCRRHDDKWTLMRILEITAHWHLDEDHYSAAKETLEEAIFIAQKAGDKGILEKALQTQQKLNQQSAFLFPPKTTYTNSPLK
jgi:predicted ATPase